MAAPFVSFIFIQKQSELVEFVGNDPGKDATDANRVSQPLILFAMDVAARRLLGKTIL